MFLVKHLKMWHKFNSVKWIFLCILLTLIANPMGANESTTLEQSHSTSVHGMGKLLLLEARIVKHIRSYMDEVDKKLNILKHALPQLQAESAKAMSQMEDYISNPLNAFSLIRRMQYTDWIDWQLFIEEPIGGSQVHYMAKHKSEMPTQTDLLEVCEAMQRLTNIYNVTATDMAKGYLNGKQYDTSLNAMDTYAIGQFYHKQQNQYMASEWFNETKNWLLTNQTMPTLMGAEPTKMLKFIAEALVEHKYYSIALPVMQHALVIGNKTHDIAELQFMSHIEQMAKEESKPAVPPPLSATDLAYSLGCSGKFAPKPKLYCKYKFERSPFLLLAPFKMEIALQDPRVTLFHDVLTDREIIELQTLAIPMLKRLSVLDTNGTIRVQNIRIAKGAWLEQNLNNLTKRIVRRMEHMTDLNLLESESMQIMNYGLAGHFIPHWDLLNTSTARESSANDRIATVLFYLSDVEQGGGTAFPNLELAVTPQRGMALFWYNMHDDGTSDFRTLHGGCPVLVGSKWVMTEWIRESNQLFARPCLKRFTN